MTEGSTPALAEQDHEGVTRHNLGFLLAKASQRWNELLYKQFVAAGYPEVRPSYGSVLIPLYEQDGLRMGEIARRARLSKQTMTSMVRLLERDRLVERRRDPADGRASLIVLTTRGRAFRNITERALSELDGAIALVLDARTNDDLKAALAQLVELDLR